MVVFQTGLEVFKYIKLYVSKRKKLLNTSVVEVIKETFPDPLTELNIAFFSSGVSVLEPFLWRF